ncbi:phosphate ABC transporter permease PstA [Salinimonas chungwhensis]|uniref:phosphate ABC transporter permease PstA n=1 Tax=Salinimonas chungwhensis TaxID=265425 RepID=UPI00035F85E1|nr:phosphate ABC transporter permease PstA [Salinimonas chungwhensis]
MISNLLKRLLSSGQRQAFFIGAGAFFTGVLLLAMVSIVMLIAARGGGYFWPKEVQRVEYISPQGQARVVFGQIESEYQQEDTRVYWLYYSDAASPFAHQSLIEESWMQSARPAKNAARIALKDGRVMLAEPVSVMLPDDAPVSILRLDAVRDKVATIEQRIAELRENVLSDIHLQLTELDSRQVSDAAPARARLNQAFDKWHAQVLALESQRDSYRMQVRLADGYETTLPLNTLYSIDYTSRLSFAEKLTVAVKRVGRFLSESPKQANTAGGVFPALFGTVLMVFLMTIIVAPFGVMAAVYLNEYAADTTLTSVIRICVSNMAGVPSIVYGVFGLGFFIYGVGGSLDALFFRDTLPAPTMGTPGVFWAALTMAILTLPVVIVATEEGLRNVPQDLKAGSYALGATKAETVWHTILPMASPGIMTGVILAIARAAGEVAPLMLVGAVKFAPNLPIDGEFPYLHLERQFMHLGVLIYDGAFHSQTDAKSASMMFAACLLLLVVVFILNILAVLLRSRLRRRYEKR